MSLDVEAAVRERYSGGAKAVEAQLCCPVKYNPQYLKAIPEEVLAKDYGCGDPSEHVRAGETVLDLGSGTGKICYIASQVVGPTGRVIGVDMNPDMLAIARRHREEVARRVGWSNVEFRRGRIQDLGLDLDALEAYLSEHPVRTADDLAALEGVQRRLRAERPLVADASVDVVVSNCVLNLVQDEDRRSLFRELFRVLKRGGRAVISDIVSDEEVPEALRQDPVLWSGCISGAFTETGFLAAFEEAGFYGVELVKRDPEPWQTVQGFEFRSVTVTAYKGKQGPCHETLKAMIYKGPWKTVTDDDGHTFHRGVREAVCEKTFQILSRAPYQGQFEPVLPREPVPEGEARPYDCDRTEPRHPRESKGLDYTVTKGNCGPSCC
jgi:ubiquinone/menaquinone biosynthesis C-methylase UbiE